MRRPALATLACVALITAQGCGSSGSAHRSRVASAPSGSTSTPQAPSSPQGALTPLSPVPTGAASPAAVVLRRYALLYGNLCSCSHAAATLNKLATLATPALAAQLRHAAANAPAQAVGTIANLELAPAHGTTQTALVVLAERTAIAHQGTTAPQPVSYTARLALTSDGWRVAALQPVPLSH